MEDGEDGLSSSMLGVLSTFTAGVDESIDTSYTLVVIDSLMRR